MPSTSSENSSRTVIVAATLIVIVALAAFLRLHGLDSQSLWTDELEAWRIASLPTAADTLDAARVDIHPPGYLLARRIVVRELGDSAVMLRLPAAVAGILAVVGMFFLGRRLFSAREGLIAAAFTAVLWVPLYYSQEARPYAAMLLFSVVTMHLLISMTTSRSSASRLRWTLWTFASLVLASIHYYGALLVVLQGGVTFALGICRKDRRPVVAVCVIALVMATWIPALIEQLGGDGVFWMSAPTWRTAFPGFVKYLFNNDPALGLLAIGTWGAACTATVFRAVRRRGRVVDDALGDDKTSPSDGRRTRSFLFARLETWILIVWFLAPLVLVYLWSVLHRPVYLDRSLIVVAPAVYLLFARGLTTLFPCRRTIIVVAISLVAIFLGHTLWVRSYHDGVHKHQYREAVARIVDGELTNGGDAEPVFALSYHPEYFDYYFERLGSTTRIAGMLGDADDLIDVQSGRVVTVGDVEAVMAARRARGFRYISAHLESDPKLLEELARRFRLVEEVAFFRATVRRYEIR